jgi:hypothetical protein
VFFRSCTGRGSCSELLRVSPNRHRCATGHPPKLQAGAPGVLRGAATPGVMFAGILDDLADLSEVEVEQEGRRALLRTAPGPSIDPVCRAVGITLPPVFQELPCAPRASAEA